MQVSLTAAGLKLTTDFPSAYSPPNIRVGRLDFSRLEAEYGFKTIHIGVDLSGEFAVFCKFLH